MRKFDPLSMIALPSNFTFWEPSAVSEDWAMFG
jgi:hypothetical protein